MNGKLKWKKIINCSVIIMIQVALTVKSSATGLLSPEVKMKTNAIKKLSYKSNKKAIIILLLPAFIIYTFLAILPILQSFYFSFFEWNGMVTSSLRFVGLNNFQDLLSYKDFYTALVNTLWFMIFSAIVQLPLAFMLAMALSTFCKGFRLFKAVIFTPVVLTMTAVSLMWYFILFPGTGLLSTLLTNLGLDFLNRNWLVDKGVAINTVILVNAWINIGFYMVIYFSAISTIDQEVLESADIDGSTGLHRVVKIILPMIWDIVKSTVVMQIAYNLRVFDIIIIMTKGGPAGQTNTLATLVYNEAFKYNHYGLGSAISTVIFVLSISLTMISLRYMNKKET